jgi:hypothetical protein
MSSDEAFYDPRGCPVAENEESFPTAVVDRIVAGESPIRLYVQDRSDAEGHPRRRHQCALSLADRTSDPQEIPLDPVAPSMAGVGTARRSAVGWSRSSAWRESTATWTDRDRRRARVSNARAKSISAGVQKLECSARGFRNRKRTDLRQ